MMENGKFVTPKNAATADRMKAVKAHLEDMLDREVANVRNLNKVSQTVITRLQDEIALIDDALTRYTEAGSPKKQRKTEKE